ncbi:MAG: OmpA family protein, partial [Desulfovibrionaceae bacterium]
DSNLGFAYTAEAIRNGLAGTADAQAEADLPAEAGTAADLAAHRSVNIRVEFDTGKATVRPEYQPYLDELGKALKSPELADKTIVVAGHTDDVGTPAANQALSERRAAAVKAYLVKTFGLDPARLLTRGYGASRPIAPNDTPENRQRNRRVEVWVNENA